LSHACTSVACVIEGATELRLSHMRLEVFIGLGLGNVIRALGSVWKCRMRALGVLKG